MDTATLVDQIDRLLPQTQCQQCGFAGCRPYAEAVARDEVPINQCPPGGAPTIRALAELLQRPELPLNPTHGEVHEARIAVIDEDLCIGCTKCLPVCPVDAILGAAKLMHTVIGSLCTGCELCLPPCPVDCISLVPRETPWDHACRDDSRQRHLARIDRLARQTSSMAQPTPEVVEHTDPEEIQAELAASIERVRERRAAARRDRPV